MVVFVALATNARAGDDWMGRRVITHYGTVLKVGRAVVDDAKRGQNLAVSGREKREVRVYRVRAVNGPWLWLVAETGGARGWAKVEQVIPIEQAIDYFTDQIRANPSSANYVSRGRIWKDRKEYDIAIADFNEAIRLDPNSDAAYNSRGVAWKAKQEYDKAIADYGQAIRLDPKYATAYLNRGNAWDESKSFDKALSDYEEAIRLDPKFVWAYQRRGFVRMKTGHCDRALADFNEAIRLDPKDPWGYARRAALEATCPEPMYRDRTKAVADATRAIDLDKTDEAYFREALAAAYAEAGDFEAAVKWQTKAIDLLPKDDETTRKDYEARLTLYRSQQPYRLASEH
jgi:tetratricopeptide (TPR) repeat protein